jgi:hypothetical protein
MGDIDEWVAGFLRADTPADVSAAVIAAAKTIVDTVADFKGLDPENDCKALLGLDLKIIHKKRVETAVKKACLLRGTEDVAQWLVSISVSDSERIAGEMCANGLDTPSLLRHLNKEEMMAQFDINIGSALKIVEAIGPSSVQNSSKLIPAPAVASSGLFRWEWRTNDGTYVEYDEAINQQIERAFKSRLPNVEFAISTSGLCYSLDLRTRRQYPVDNTQDGGDEISGRMIRRWDSILNPPPSWDHQVDKFESFEVDLGTSDYELVSRTLRERFDGGVEFTPLIVRIQRLQNKPLLRRYNLEKKIMTDKRGAAAAGSSFSSSRFFSALIVGLMHFQRKASGTFFSAQKILHQSK